jgi:hypothetical protein
MLGASEDAKVYFENQLRRDKSLPSEQRTVQRFIACAAAACEHYAAALQTVSAALPAKLQALPAIVSEAARGLRLSQTLREASSVLKRAISAVQKVIRLIRADDPDGASTEKIEAASVSRTLGVFNVGLERAISI